jgi:protease II
MRAEDGTIDQDLQQYLASENNYCNAFYNSNHSLIEQLARKLTSSKTIHTMQEPYAAMSSAIVGAGSSASVSVPEHVGAYWYYTVYLKNSEFPVYCRSPFTDSTQNANQIELEIRKALSKSPLVSGAWQSMPSCTSVAQSTTTRKHHQQSPAIEIQVLVDQNKEGEQYEFIGVELVHISPCGRYVGFTRVWPHRQRMPLLQARHMTMQHTV